MSYRISYVENICERNTGKGNNTRVYLLSAMLFGMFLLLVKAFWQEGYDTLYQLFGMKEIWMIDEGIRYICHALRGGHTLPEAIQTFCKEILIYGQPLG